MAGLWLKTDQNHQVVWCCLRAVRRCGMAIAATLTASVPVSAYPHAYGGTRLPLKLRSGACLPDHTLMTPSQ